MCVVFFSPRKAFKRYHIIVQKKVGGSCSQLCGPVGSTYRPRLCAVDEESEMALHIFFLRCVLFIGFIVSLLMSSAGSRSRAICRPHPRFNALSPSLSPTRYVSMQGAKSQSLSLIFVCTNRACGHKWVS